MTVLIRCRGGSRRKSNAFGMVLRPIEGIKSSKGSRDSSNDRGSSTVLNAERVVYRSSSNVPSFQFTFGLCLFNHGRPRMMLWTSVATSKCNRSRKDGGANKMMSVYASIGPPWLSVPVCVSYGDRLIERECREIESIDKGLVDKTTICTTIE